MSAKQHKYRARRTACKQGHTHPSIKEAKRCNELSMLQRVGEIKDLRQQPKFVLQSGFFLNSKWIRPIRYTADFKYKEGDRIVVEDTKGYLTPVYRIKLKLFLNQYCADGTIIFRET